MDKSKEIPQDIPRAKLPLCATCKNLTVFENRILKCKAYPEGIPKEILTWKEDHRHPLPGDNGIQYEKEK